VFEDRDRIGRDLHDLVIQRLFATGVQLQRAARSDGLPADVVDRINAAVDDLDATVKEIRQTIFALQSADTSVGVRSRVLHEVASATPGLGFAPTVHFTGTIDAQVSDRIADHLVAALREALSNASRHAHASSVSVAVVVDASSVELTVTDDGRGFELGGRRSGLANLATRATESNGVCEVFSSAGEGTRLVWRAPLGSNP